jgi:PAS domain S-box-containing protein
MGFWPISEHRLNRATAGSMLGGGKQRRETLVQRSPLLSYLCAVVLAILAQIARIPLHPQTALPLITYVPVIALSAWYCGLRPGLVTTVLCTGEYLYFVTRPVHMADWQNWVGVLILPLAGVVAGRRFERFRKTDRSGTLAQSQADLLRSNLAAIVDSSDDAIIGKDLRGVITSWNRSAEKIFGYSASEAIGQHITFFMDPRIANEELAIQAKIGKGESVDHYETRRRRKDGTEVFISVSVSPIKDASGKIIGASKIARDVTERKRNEEIRARQAQDLLIQTTLLQNVFRHSPTAIAVLEGPEFAFEMVNPEYQALQPGVAMVGKTVAELWPDAAPIVLPLLRRVRDTRLPYHAIAMPIPRRRAPDEQVEERFFTFSYVPLVDLDVSREARILVVALDVTDMKRIELGLREKARLLDLSNDAILVRNAQDLIAYWNAGAAEVYGYMPDEALGHRAHELLHTEFPEPLNAIFETLRCEGRWSGELVHIRKDGTKIAVSSRWVADRDGQRNIRAILETNSDITERKQAEEALRRAAEFDEAALKSIGEGLVTIDTDGLVTSMNPAAEELLGWTFGELRSKNLHTMIHHHHPDGRLFPSSECAGFQVLRHGPPLKNHEDVFIRRDGTFFDVTYSNAPLRDAAGRITGLVYVFNDLSERKRAEKALRESEERLRTQMERMPIGCIVFDRHNCFTQMNPAAERILGHTAAELCGQHASVIVPESARSHVDDILRRLAEGDMTAHSENENVTKDGVSIICQWTNTPLRDGAGNFIGFLSMIQDITERKRAEQVLRESEEQLRLLSSDLERRVQKRTSELVAINKELESFTYSVSHDLRAPLRGIDGWSAALLEDYGEKLDEQAREYLGRVRAETQRMGHLIDDLLRLSRVTRAEMRTTQVDLSALANSITRRIREANPERNTEFTIEPGLKGEGDPRLLEIALTNLLDNAVKFSSKRNDAKVEFGAASHSNAGANRSGFFVRDNGAGFDMTYASQLFGAFQRLHSASEFPGTGIGLATVQRVILRHGGTICAESKPDEGATFYFTIGGAN